ncbi:hypothetical protein CH380_08485 [Leptospira adleri]|uniref:Uncharacterized protein n=1 Tax=Leptospira adleri TaxID=2023186 RepID=A0A2M9YQ45_9LEPT|nr:hypothetical protein CH380_08485 [Leptospira adleri]PJZ60237.1 hypothetical protein CH376_19495 [Leptospira adleri]
MNNRQYGKNKDSLINFWTELRINLPSFTARDSYGTQTNSVKYRFIGVPTKDNKSPLKKEDSSVRNLDGTPDKIPSQRQFSIFSRAKTHCREAQIFHSDNYL